MGERFSPAEREIVVRMAAAKASAKDIAAELSKTRPEATRSAVIGYCRRQKIKLLMVTGKSWRGGKKPLKPKLPRPDEYEIATAFQGVGKTLLLDTPRDRCHWPFGDPPTACGEPVAPSGSLARPNSYCARHMRLSVK